MAAPANPCTHCEYRQDCGTNVGLERLIYDRPTFKKPVDPAAFIKSGVGRATYDLLTRIVAAWRATVGTLTDPSAARHSLAALFDLLISGLYAQRIHDPTRGRTTTQAFCHTGDGETLAFHPYLWMCPACVAAGVEPSQAYLPGSELRGAKRYPGKDLLSRPNGRMIGDFGALALRAIIEHLIGPDAHYASGAGHRGEFDLIIATEEQLILGEIKASPLVAFPIGVTQPVAPQRHHTWTTELEPAGDWFLFAGAAPEAERRLPIGAPTDDLWPLPDLVHLAESRDRVAVILTAWERHLAGYRLFNAEAPGTRWLRFGCGNIETRDPATGTRVQLRVDNTKSLPGIDRTDDIKKGIAQVMLFGRLKKGCRTRAVKTVLFGNLYAETHHEHYVKPLSSLRLMWPDEAPVNLFDAIIALSRNIINDPAVEKLVGLASEPYAADTVDVVALAEGLFAHEPDA